MGNLFGVQIIIAIFFGLAYALNRRNKLLRKIYGAIIAIFIILDLILLLAGLQNWLI